MKMKLSKTISRITFAVLSMILLLAFSTLEVNAQGNITAMEDNEGSPSDDFDD